MNKFRHHLSLILDSTKHIKELEIDNKILSLFKNHDRIIFCTMGKSAFACRKIVHTARSFSLEWHDLDVCHAFHGDAGLVRDGDLLVFVSKSGNTKETVDVAKYFNHHEKVSITSGSKCELDKYCKHKIYIPVPSEGSPFGYAPMASTSSYMIVMHAIMCSVIEYKNITLNTFAKNHPAGSIGDKLR